MTGIPARPLLMGSFCALGTVLGLAIDCRSVTPAALASLCTAGTVSPLTGFVRHLALLPATSIGMLSGGFIALGLGGVISLRVAGVNLACNALMLLGMFLAACLGPSIAARFGVDWDAMVMLAAMAAGMTLGMMAAAPLCRFGIRPLSSSPSPPFRGAREES